MKILLLQLKRIGDLILTTPSIRCLREAFPDAQLALVADSSCASLLDSIAVDERWIYHKGAGLKGMAGWGLNAWLKRRPSTLSTGLDAGLHGQRPISVSRRALACEATGDFRAIPEENPSEN